RGQASDHRAGVEGVLPRLSRLADALGARARRRLPLGAVRHLAPPRITQRAAVGGPLRRADRQRRAVVLLEAAVGVLACRHAQELPALWRWKISELRDPERLLRARLLVARFQS